MIHPYHLEAFEKHFQQVASGLEKRRQRYKLQFIIMLAASMALLIAGTIYNESTLLGLLDELHMFGIIEAKNSVTLGEQFAFFFFTTLIAIVLPLHTIYSYRGAKLPTGYVPQNYALKDHAFSQLIRYFGDFAFAPKGGDIGAKISEHTIIPEHKSLLMEDNMKGIINDYTAFVTEARLLNTYDHQRVAIFQGLMLLIDISEVRVKLSRDFSGRTVLIADERKNIGSIEKNYSGLENVALQTPEHEKQFELYADNKEEALALVTPQIIGQLVTLHRLVSQATQQVEHIDTKIKYAFEAIIDKTLGKLRGNTLSKMPLINQEKLPAVAAYDKAHEADLDTGKADPIAMHRQAINQSIQLECYKDKMLITIPCQHDLFETNSIFEPAINKEDGMILFEIMRTIHMLTSNIQSYMQK